MSLDPEEDVEEESADLHPDDEDDEVEVPTRARKAGTGKGKQNQNQRAKPKTQSRASKSKSGRVSDFGGRAVHTEYYNHASYDEMPDTWLDNHNEICFRISSEIIRAPY